MRYLICDTYDAKPCETLPLYGAGSSRADTLHSRPAAGQGESMFFLHREHQGWRSRA